MEIKRIGFFFLLSFSLFSTGCATLFPERIPPSFERPKKCQEFFDQLDQKVDGLGVRDASSFLLPGFPYLRTSRFLSAMRERVRDEKEKEQWIQWMRSLDLKARKKEIAHLTSRETESLDRPSYEARLSFCSNWLLHSDKGRAEFDSVLSSRLEVPDEYSTFMRVIGLYPLFLIPVAGVTENVRSKIRSTFESDLKDLPIDGRLQTYAPRETLCLDEEEVREMIKASKNNPLGIPLPDENQEARLIRHFAPIFIQDVATPYDPPGRVVWKEGRPAIDLQRPTAYTYLSHSFLKGEPILQINYVIWYSAREGKVTPWIERGSLDGITLRISLDGEGRPFMVDVVSNCGCYHFFAPQKERVDHVVSKPLAFDPFVPQWLPEVPPKNRFGIRVSSARHEVQRVLSLDPPPGSVPYEIVPYEDLERLLNENGDLESLFDGEGIAKGTERIERFILFSMGIPWVGSMRQRGHHAIELIGRVHFDDPYLFDRSFVFK
jgi:hypothetical protein